MKKESPSLELWLREAKQDASAADCGMYLIHNGTVRRSAKAKVRQQAENTLPVRGMRFSYDREKTERAIREAQGLPGVGYVRVWLNEGELSLGDDIMYVLIGGDIRPHVVDALQRLVGTLKNECVTEEEIY